MFCAVATRHLTKVTAELLLKTNMEVLIHQSQSFENGEKNCGTF